MTNGRDAINQLLSGSKCQFCFAFNVTCLCESVCVCVCVSLSSAGVIAACCDLLMSRIINLEMSC